MDLKISWLIKITKYWVCVTGIKYGPNFPIHHGGCDDITDHKEARKCKFTEGTSTAIPEISYVEKAVPEDDDLTHAAAGGVFIHHSVKHNTSFRSSDYPIK